MKMILKDIMRKLYYMGLEPYKARYTLQLQEWNISVFNKRGLDYVIVPGETLSSDQAIVTGQVLDAHGRSYFGMSQLMNLVKMMKAGEVTSEDVIYFEDMFQPGFESLPYILNQVSEAHRPKIFVRCLAQSIDPDDFVHVWGMAKWMGSYEKMVCEAVSQSGGAILATNEEMVMNMKIAGWEAPIYNISGLAFGKAEVRGRVSEIKPFNERQNRVVFAARWDQEKQPDFFMDVIEEYYKRFDQQKNYTKFTVLSGAPLRSNNQSYMERTQRMRNEGKLSILEDLSKDEYYAILNDSKVMFNCALQDWVSNTVSEADALGCNVVYPAYRSFPETFANDSDRLYIPWSVDDAAIKLYKALHEPHAKQGKISDWNDSTIDRICDILEGNGEQWLRMDNDYRKHTRESKY
jgi:glycosyltransferase involved in cell wall biosynthesis